MLRFYFNGKLFGICIIVINVMSVSSQGWLKVNVENKNDFNYTKFRDTKTCQEEGKGEMTHVTGIRLKGSNLYYDIDLNNASSSYKALLEKITRECNGRSECTSSDSKIPTPKMISLPTKIPVKEIHIVFVCKPKTVDNSTVFNIGLDLEVNKCSTKKCYLVLELHENTNIHRHCNISGISTVFPFTVLHVDFGNYSDCGYTKPNYLRHCNPNMTLVSRDKERCNVKWIPTDPFKMSICNAKNVDIDIHMSSGFVWIEFEAGSDLKLTCSGSKRNIYVTSYSPTPEGLRDVIYTIVIPVSVAFLVLLIVISSFVYCVCRRSSRFQVWKRTRGESALQNRRDVEYNNVTSNELLDATYNTVDTPAATRTRTRADNDADDDYAEIASSLKTTASEPGKQSAAHQMTNNSIKTQASPASSELSFKIECQGEGPTYARMNKVKKVETATSSGTGTVYGNISHHNLADVNVSTPRGGDTVYSHLASFEKKRNYENVYNG